MTDCIFCKIVAGQLPHYKTYEDDDYLGLLDHRPLNPGNCLLIPKKHYRWVYDVSKFGEYWEAAKKLSTAIKKVVNCEYISFLTLGNEVPHAHIRIVPRFYNDGHVDGIRISAVKNISKTEMKEIAEKIFTEINKI